MQTILGIIVGLLTLMALIVAHEFGHFLAARRNGVRVKEFAIGFPPRAIAWMHVPPKKSGAKGKNGRWTWRRLKKSEWGKDQETLVFSLNWLPIGGFCAMDGESDDDPRSGTFGAASFWGKTKILFAGVAMNWLVAFIILTVLAWTGLPTLIENQFTIKSNETVHIVEPITVGEVLENSPAATAGFQSGDQLLSAENPACTNNSLTPCTVTFYASSDVIAFNQDHSGETVRYRISRSGQSQVLTATLNEADAEYLLGLTMSLGNTERSYTWSAPLVGAGLTVQLTGETFKGLGNLVVSLASGAVRQVSPSESTRAEGREQVSEATAGVSGIVGIVGGLFPSILSAGATYVALLAAVISISLACMNVLPIPALDGGRWFMIFLARLQHKKLSKDREAEIVGRAFIFLLILMAIITVVDIIRLF
ncbi:site-2 protease family protein [Candidatus Saccharibacteria bacterium]|nr:site-2 protease family protein [Candidatus Saccharibacteria bacterium]